MPKTITITIHEPYLKVLEKWASVGRTLNTARQACEDIDNDSLTESELEKYSHCVNELEELTPALEHLLYQTQQQLWHGRGASNAVTEK